MGWGSGLYLGIGRHFMSMVVDMGGFWSPQSSKLIMASELLISSPATLINNIIIFFPLHGCRISRFLHQHQFPLAAFCIKYWIRADRGETNSVHTRSSVTLKKHLVMNKKKNLCYQCMEKYLKAKPYSIIINFGASVRRSSGRRSGGRLLAMT